MEIKKKNSALTGFVWKFGERITAQVITFVVSIVLARILFPEDYGIVAIVTIFISLANALVNNGFGSSLVQNKESDETDFSTMFWTSVFFSFALYGLLFLLSPLISDLFGNKDLTLVLRIMSLRLPFGAINSIQQAYIQKRMAFKLFFVATLIGTIVSAVVGITMALKGFGVWALVCQYLTNVVIDTIVLMIIIDWHPRFVFSFQRFKVLFSYGWKVMAASFIGTLFNEIKGLIIGIKYSSVDLAFYNRGNQIPSLITTNVESSVESVAFPILSNIHDDRENFKKTIRKMMKICSYVMFPILFGLAAIAHPMVLVLLTEKWKDAIPFVIVISIGLTASVLNVVNMQAIKASGSSDVYLKLEFIKKPIYLLIIIGCMFISPLAVAIGNAIYGFIAIIINSFPNRKIINYKLLEQIKDVSPYFIMSLIMFGVVFPIYFLPLKNWLILIIQIPVGVAVYFGLSALFRPEAFIFCANILRRKMNKEKKDVQTDF